MCVLWLQSPAVIHCEAPALASALVLWAGRPLALGYLVYCCSGPLLPNSFPLDAAGFCHTDDLAKCPQLGWNCREIPHRIPDKARDMDENQQGEDCSLGLWKSEWFPVEFQENSLVMHGFTFSLGQTMEHVGLQCTNAHCWWSPQSLRPRWPWVKYRKTQFPFYM